MKRSPWCAPRAHQQDVSERHDLKRQGTSKGSSAVRVWPWVQADDRSSSAAFWGETTSIWNTNPTKPVTKYEGRIKAFRHRRTQKFTSHPSFWGLCLKRGRGKMRSKPRKKQLWVLRWIRPKQAEKEALGRRCVAYQDAACLGWGRRMKGNLGECLLDGEGSVGGK